MATSKPVMHVETYEVCLGSTKVINSLTLIVFNPYRQQVTCLRCGRVRTVNEYLLCGPCSLRAKVGM